MKVRVSKNFFIILCLDILLLMAAHYGAYLVRFDFSVSSREFAPFLTLLPYVLLIKIAAFYYFDLYSGMWRYTSLNDLFNVIKASTAASVALILFVLARYRFEGFSRSIFLIDYCFTLIAIAGVRVAARVLFEQSARRAGTKALFQNLVRVLREKKSAPHRILIIGAGDCGEKILREIKDNASIRYQVVGFLDDDRVKKGRKIHGVPVLDKISRLPRVVDRLGVSDVVIAIPSADAARIRSIVELCKYCSIKFKTVPGMGELIDGRVTVNAIRDVEFRDLLGRKPVELDQEQIGAFLKGKTVFVSGAGGSIGRGLCRQICRFAPSKIILFEWAESPLYEIDLELRRNYPNVSVIAHLGDVQHIREIENVFDRFSPEIVFHAAAYKHVPMLEAHPWKAVENNIMGTENMVDVADRYGCEKFVFVSTDKAVNPANIMGASKRVSEMIVQHKSMAGNSATRFVTVRFGNVIGSAGSVIPLFKKQIKNGGPVTVTHPEVVRYFMLIPEACQLILQAGAMGKGGEIFILEMGAPVKIAEMARDLIRFSGFEPDVDIKIEYVGLRPGEKLYEELMTDHENVVATDHAKIMVLNCASVDVEILDPHFAMLKQAARQRNQTAIRQYLKSILPEYSCPGQEVMFSAEAEKTHEITT